MNLSSSVTIPTPKGHTKHCHTAWCRSCLLIYKACLLCNAARTKWIREKQRMSTKEKRQRIISFKMAFHIYKALRSLWNSIPTTPCFLNPSNILKNDLQSLPSISTTTFCKFAEFFSWWPHLTCLLYLRNTFQLLFWNMESLNLLSCYFIFNTIWKLTPCWLHEYEMCENPVLFLDFPCPFSHNCRLITRTAVYNACLTCKHQSVLTTFITMLLTQSHSLYYFIIVMTLELRSQFWLLFIAPTIIEPFPLQKKFFHALPSQTLLSNSRKYLTNC